MSSSILARGAISMTAALLALATTPSATAQQPTWPPVGPKWITDPAEAFAKAQHEKKAVMAFVATAG